MRAVTALLLVIMPAPALAQDFWTIDQTKTYASDPAACGADDIGEALILSFPKGIEAYEYHCDFFDIKSVEGSPFLFVEAVCEAPGARNPDLLSISPYDESSIEVVSLYDTSNLEGTEANPNPGTVIYHRCD